MIDLTGIKISVLNDRTGEQDKRLMKKRLFGILLSLALAAGMMPALSMNAYAVDYVIQEGSTYAIDDWIYFGDDTPLWVQMDDGSGKEYKSFTGTAHLAHNQYISYTGQHAFTLQHDAIPYNLCISDTDSRVPWGIAVTGGDGSSQEKAFTFKVLHKAPVEYQLWIKGTQVTNWNKDDVLGDGTVSYDPEKNILTLNGANITTDADSQKIYSHVGIYYSGDEPLIIDAEKASTVTAMEGSMSSTRCFAASALSIPTVSCVARICRLILVRLMVS
jgi:hypothetical protein